MFCFCHKGSSLRGLEPRSLGDECPHTPDRELTDHCPPLPPRHLLRGGWAGPAVVPPTVWAACVCTCVRVCECV